MTVRKWRFCARLGLRLLVLLALPLGGQCQTKESAAPKPNNWIAVRLLTHTDSDSDLGLQLSQYLQGVSHKVKSKWQTLIPQSVRPDENESVVVRVRIAGDGTLAGKRPTIAHSCGKKELDDAAIRAIQDSAPFERLPLSVEQIEVGIEFNYGRSVRKM